MKSDTYQENTIKCLLISTLLCGSLIILFPLTALSAEQAGKVIMARGDISAINLAGEKRPLARRSLVYSGDKIVTGKGARIQIRFTDNGLISIWPESVYHIEEYSYNKNNKSGKISAALARGGFRTISGLISKADPKSYSLKTPVATVGVRGTEYSVGLDEFKNSSLNSTEATASRDLELSAVREGGFNMNVAVKDGTIELSPVDKLEIWELGEEAEYSYATIDIDGKINYLTEPPKNIQKNIEIEYNLPPITDNQANNLSDPEENIATGDETGIDEESFNTIDTPFEVTETEDIFTTNEEESIINLADDDIFYSFFDTLPRNKFIGVSASIDSNDTNNANSKPFFVETDFINETNPEMNIVSGYTIDEKQVTGIDISNSSLDTSTSTSGTGIIGKVDGGNLIKPGNTTVGIITDVYWGYWDETGTDPIYTNSGTGNTINKHLFWIVAEPIDINDMHKSGTYSYNSAFVAGQDSTTGNHLDSIEMKLDINFSDNTFSGDMKVSSDSGASTWTASSVAGSVNGITLDFATVSGTHTHNTNQTNNFSGEVTGTFVSKEDIIGGFNFTDDAGTPNSVAGVYELCQDC